MRSEQYEAKGKLMATTTTITLRIPEDLLKKLDSEIVPRERDITGVRNLTRNDVLIKAIDSFIRQQAAAT